MPMRRFTFDCPRTGYRVRGWLPDEDLEHGLDTYEAVRCHACGGQHWVNPKSARVLGTRRRREEHS
jgi:hypothetical protein